VEKHHSLSGLEITSAHRFHLQSDGFLIFQEAEWAKENHIEVFLLDTVNTPEWIQTIS